VNSIGTLVNKDGNRSIRAGVWNMRCHFFHNERISDDETNYSRVVALGSLANDRPVIELDKQHQSCSTQNAPDYGFQVRGRFRRMHRLPELSHIRVSDRSLDRCNNVMERLGGDYREPLHFHFSDHSDFLLE
jgi:hypothetical protein